MMCAGRKWGGELMELNENTHKKSPCISEVSPELIAANV